MRGPRANFGTVFAGGVVIGFVGDDDTLKILGHSGWVYVGSRLATVCERRSGCLDLRCC